MTSKDFGNQAARPSGSGVTISAGKMFVLWWGGRPARLTAQLRSGSALALSSGRAAGAWAFLFVFLLFFALLTPIAGAADFAASSAVNITARWSSVAAHNSAKASKQVITLHPGDQRALAIVLHIKPGYHVNPNSAQIPDDMTFRPISTQVTASWPKGSSSLMVGQAQFPKPHLRRVQYAKKPLPVFENKAVIYLPVVVKDSAKPGNITLALQIRYQTCNDQVCLRPRTVTRNLTIKISGKKNAPVAAGQGALAGGAAGGLFAGFDPSAFAAMQSGGGAIFNTVAGGETSASITNDFFGYTFTLNSGAPIGLALILLVALVAGFLLNFTPCVLPVVPLKIMALQQQAGSNRARRLAMGGLFCLGIVATFAFLGALVAGLVIGLGQFQWGSIFSYAPVSIALGAIIILMALGMLDVFSFRLPQWVYAIRPSHDSAHGNFLFGVLTAVLSTPCTGPLLGATIVWAVRQSAFLAIGSFVVMGIGMALPYALLAANPKWLSHLPRTGPGSQLLKQTLALLLLAVAGFFLSPVIPGQGVWWLIAGFIIVAMLWAAYRTFCISKKIIPRLAVAVLAIVFIYGSASAAWMLTSPGPIAWQPYSKQAFIQAQKNGKTVLVEFTADWCGNCKALELTVYRDPELAALFHGKNYKAFRIDLTSSANEKGWQLQRKLAPGAGIPLAAIYHPQKSRPTAVFQGLFTASQLITALEKPALNEPRTQ